MRLFEAIIDANHRALAGGKKAGLHPGEFADELPVAALTCIDPRLNSLLPQVLGLPSEKFVWLRNAGNVVGGPSCSTIRSFSMACAINGCKEIAIIGHTDCLAGRTPTMQLIGRLKALGIRRNVLPESIVEFSKTFGNERQNVIKGAERVRQSPLISSKIPIHGLLVDTATGKVEWLVNGYQSLAPQERPMEKALI
ncbi:MAG: carbonic anhydrase [Verrucomicrobiota bacterium]